LCLLDIAAHAGGGSAVALFQDGPLRGRLREAGVTVDVLPASPSVLEVRRDTSPPILAVAAGVGMLAVRLAARARRFEVLYANSQKALVVAAPAGVMARRPVVWHLHDLLTDEHFGRAQRRLSVTLARHFVARVIANSQATADAYVAAGGRPEHVRVIYNGIDAAPFDAVGEAETRLLRDELGIGDAPLVGLFGRIASWKGQSVLIEALSALPGVHALLVGEALFESDHAVPAALRDLAGALGMSERIHMLGFRPDVPVLMRACDVVVHASTSAEPFGRVIVEGMLSGTPVIASAAGGALELVEDGTTGLLVPPGDAQALGASIGRLLADPCLAARLATAAGSSARRRFAAADVRGQIAKVLGEAAEGILA
jgi:glycosyltransferase involved in cell wall biosynthesis